MVMLDQMPKPYANSASCYQPRQVYLRNEVNLNNNFNSTQCNELLNCWTNDHDELLNDECQMQRVIELLN